MLTTKRPMLLSSFSLFKCIVHMARGRAGRLRVCVCMCGGGVWGEGECEGMNHTTGFRPDNVATLYSK